MAIEEVATGGGARGHGERRTSSGSAAVMAAQRTAARAPTRLAWPLCGLGLALLGATLLVLLVGRPPARPGGEAWQRQAADLLGRAGAPLLGGLIAARRPDNPYGWLWLALG